MYSTACWPAWPVGGAAPGTAAGVATIGETCAAAACVFGMILSVSRRISFTLMTIESHSRFSEETSTCAMAPVLVPLVVALPCAELAEANWVEASELIFTLRAALR